VRYRLRFHLQEVDLRGDEVVIGRGSMCHVTIDDPMLSRRHVRIDLKGSQPTIEDLDSRNGTQLNGRPLSGSAPLRDGDRIRIGARELVFLAPRRINRDFRTTSGMTFCVGCAVPYPSASAQCPHCGAISTVEAGVRAGSDVAPTGWTFHLLAQVVERAIEQGRLADAERMLSRGVAELDERSAAGVAIDARRVIRVAESAARLGCALRTRRWLDVSTRLHGHCEATPSGEILTLLDRLPTDSGLADAVDALRRSGTETHQSD
jgi:hypothetical protein